MEHTQTIRLLIASGNKHKIQEIQGFFEQAGLSVSCLPAQNLEGLTEDASTFAENARLKAKFVRDEARQRQCDFTLGDDSGFVVHALSGVQELHEFPGVRSNRWLTPAYQQVLLGGAVQGELTHTHRCQALYSLLGEALDRSGEFVCAMALAPVHSEQPLHIVEGRCPVWVRPDGELVGTNGFGYDPMVHPLNEQGLPQPRTMAELSSEEKNAISHRGLALQQLAEVLARNRAIPSK
jgi:XTP/dITP diphosphohydrolase